MGIHGQSSNFKLLRSKRTVRHQKKMLKQKRKGALHEDDFALDSRTILRRRKTNPFAPSDLSKKKRNKIIKLLRFQEKEQADKKRKEKQNQVEMKNASGSSTGSAAQPKEATSDVEMASTDVNHGHKQKDSSEEMEDI